MKAFKTVSQLVELIAVGSYHVSKEAKSELKAKADTHKDCIESGKDILSFYMIELEYEEDQAFKAYFDNLKAYEIATAFTHDVI